MDWKKEAIEDLRGHVKRKVALENLQERMEILQSEFEAPKSAAMGMAAGKQKANSVEERVVKNIYEREKLAENLKATQRMVEIVERGLLALEPEQRRILQGFYGDGQPYKAERLAEDLHMDRASVYRARDEALRQFTMAMYGVVEQ